MMALVTRIDGSAVVHEADCDLVISRLEAALETEGASAVMRDGNSLVFSVNLLRWRSNWNILTQLEAGTISATRDKAGILVTYSLSMMRMFLIVTAIVLVGIGPQVYFGAKTTPAEATAIMAAAWLWLFGANALTARYRLPRWVAKVSSR